MMVLKKCIQVALLLIAVFGIQNVFSNVEGFYVCRAGRNSSNAHYKRCDVGQEYSTACLSLKEKEILFFDAVPPYHWQIYTYEGPLKRIHIHYQVNVTDFVDPPRTGWYSVEDGIDPPPIVVGDDDNVTSCP